MSKHSLQDPVLVVDDEADIRDLMEMTLMKMGLSVETAVGVTDAKAKLDDNDYSLVLTDMRMPDGSCFWIPQGNTAPGRCRAGALRRRQSCLDRSHTGHGQDAAFHFDV